MSKHKNKLTPVSVNPDFAESRMIAIQLSERKSQLQIEITDERIDALARTAVMIWYENWINSSSNVKFSEYLISIGV